ncbi:MAG: hypothetical protein WBV73_10205 [Phormidium sp.]
MSFSVFNESFYLAQNPDVQAAVNAGYFSSGLEHFQKFGLAERRVSISPFYDEQFYLQKQPDVNTAVTSGIFRSGLQHFISAGETEGRQASLLFDEQFYLQRNIDVAAAVTSSIFSSGLAHYLQIGQSENRSGTNFNEFGYIGLSTLQKVNADVEAAVKAGYFGSALEHYIQYGQFEGRRGIFNGTVGNDTVTGFGQIETLYGVDAFVGEERIAGSLTGGQALYFGRGINEIDVLVGGNGQDTFVLGQSVQGRPNFLAFPFYRSNGDADYATIKNYEIGKDEIVLAGAASYYDFVQSGDSLNIILSRTSIDSQPLATPDLIGTVEGVTSVNQLGDKLRFTGGLLFS